MRLLCVHPNYELYGSDRSFAHTVAALGLAWPDAKVEVRLPKDGPITTLSPFDKTPPTIQPMWILRRRNLVSGLTIHLWSNVKTLFAALRDMNASDLSYVNTVISFNYILMARFSRRPVIIHVREIPNGLEMKVFRRLLIWSKATLMFNSRATEAAFTLPRSIRTHVIYNGFADPGTPKAADWDGRRPLKILVMGRINHWKGQETVISAIGLLSAEERRRIEVRVVGGTFNNQDDFRARLENQIKEMSLGDIVRIEPFEDNPAPSFAGTDIVVVPSRLPEPFGRVAIEAMAFGKPVVATAHGGLLEIVKDGVTGRLFSPSDAAALANVLREFLEDPAQVARLGACGRDYFEKFFTQQASDEAFLAAMRREMTTFGVATAPSFSPQSVPEKVS